MTTAIRRLSIKLQKVVESFFLKSKRSLIILLFFTPPGAIAQIQPEVKQNTSGVYRGIESLANRSGFTKFVYKLFFNPVAPILPGKQEKLKKEDTRLERSYGIFQDKIIRNIKIITLDPFGYSVNDTSELPSGFVSKTGNLLHKKTMAYAIRNLLLIGENKVFDSLRVHESERLVRSQSYLRDVNFYTELSGNNFDSVDITIRVLDVWSIIVEGTLTTSRFNIDVTDKNFMGLGHELLDNYDLYFDTPNQNEIGYFIPNIHNSYINSRISFKNDALKNYKAAVNLERPFYSPFTKWGAGAHITNDFRRDSLIYNESTRIYQRYSLLSQDYWLARAWQVFKGSSEEDIFTNLIFSLRYLNSHYLEKPASEFDLEGIYNDENYYLVGIGINTRRYEQDKYIFKYGLIEDIPIGRVYSLVAGYNKKNNVDRFYLGLSFSRGSYFRWGYMSHKITYGTFLNDSKFEQGLLSLSTNVFSDLLDAGRWKIRQFIKPEIMIGINRKPGDKITINDDNGIQGFSSDELTGTKKVVLTLQTQSYAPWSVIGFRFGPYLTYSMGMLADDENGFKKSRVYSQIGLGFLIRNDFLVFRTFQISFAFYPVIPGAGNNIFKLNPLKSTDLGLRDFDISKPEIIPYQ